MTALIRAISVPWTASRLSGARPASSSPLIGSTTGPRAGAGSLARWTNRSGTRFQSALFRRVHRAVQVIYQQDNLLGTQGKGLNGSDRSGTVAVRETRSDSLQNPNPTHLITALRGLIERAE